MFSQDRQVLLECTVFLKIVVNLVNTSATQRPSKLPRMLTLAQLARTAVTRKRTSSSLNSRTLIPLPPRSAMRLTALLSMAARVVIPKDYRFGTNRPWTAAAKRLNPPGKKRRKVFVEPMAAEDWSVLRGDTVEILAGKDKGKQGKVIQVFRHRNWVMLEGLNTHHRYIGKGVDSRGTYIASEAPILLRDVALIDPSDRKPADVQWKFTEEGERVRVSLRTGRIIPKPVVQRRDGIVQEQWKDGPKDTSPEDTLAKTYVPSLKTLEEEVMETLGIQENRRHRRSYWY